ncbi:hypothetical protein HYALB_00010486 [Hymenoscyphus albidus]|uniref:Uncharacterized protein n=1 Tax=Hymenoscyphus albidus TaxID=595503 RepID=A0A9N9Q4H1_9HELO|nr:hypothetical protein HYALB_00010486 [Hymenoscyphus albidus]
MSELDAREAALVLREEAVVIREAQLAAGEAAFASKEETHTGPEAEAQDFFSKIEDEGEAQSQLQQVPELVSEGRGEVAVLELMGEQAAEVDKAKDDLKTEEFHPTQDPEYVADSQAGASGGVNGDSTEEGVKVKVEDKEVASQELTPDHTLEGEHKIVDASPKAQAEPSKVIPESGEETPSTKALTQALPEDIHPTRGTKQTVQPHETKDIQALKSEVPPRDEPTDTPEKDPSSAPIDEPTLTGEKMDIHEPNVESASISRVETTAPVLQDTTPDTGVESTEEQAERFLAERSASEPESSIKGGLPSPTPAEKSLLPEAQSGNTMEGGKPTPASASTRLDESKVGEGENTIVPHEGPASTQDEDVSDTNPNASTSTDETEHLAMPIERKVDEPVEKAEATQDEVSNTVKKVTFEAEDASPDLAKEVQNPLEEGNFAVNRGLPVQGQSV